MASRPGDRFFMGVMRFILSPPERNSEQVVEQAYLTGFDRIPNMVRARAEGDTLVLQHSGTEAVNLHVPWDVAGYERLTLSTGTLVESATPYPLPLELARGRLGLVRNQAAEWEVAGLAVPDSVRTAVREATRYFSRAAVHQQQREQSSQLAEQSLRASLDAAAQLVAAYANQALPLRIRYNGRQPLLQGGVLGSSLLDDVSTAQFLQTFNVAGVPFSWREIEIYQGSFLWDTADKQVAWCQMHGLPVFSGPLLELDRRSLPDWVHSWGDNFDALFSFVTSYVQAVVSRYRGKVAIWQCAGRVNSSDLLALSEEQHLRLVAQVVEVIRSLDRDAPIVFSVNQPWGEYLLHRQREFPPWQFADVLIRAGLGLGGLVLETNLGYFPGGTRLRDGLDWSRLLDYWAVLGLPLYISLCLPSGAHEDPLANTRTHVSPSWTPQAQEEWVAQHVPFLLAKPYVSGILWNQLRDGEPHDFPHGGLFALDRTAKPVQVALAAIRQTYLR